MIAGHLGGGSLLDLGPYPMVWTMLLLHQHPLNTLNGGHGPSGVTGHMTLYPRTGVDASSAWVVEWAGVGTSVCTTSMDIEPSLGGRERAVVVQMERGELAIHCECNKSLRVDCRMFTPFPPNPCSPASSPVPASKVYLDHTSPS